MTKKASKPPHLLDRSYVLNRRYGVWETSETAWCYAHEMGHLMNLPDQYDTEKDQVSNPNYGTAFPGHEFDMMGATNMNVQPHEMGALLQDVDCHCGGSDIKKV